MKLIVQTNTETLYAFIISFFTKNRYVFMMDIFRPTYRYDSFRFQFNERTKIHAKKKLHKTNMICVLIPETEQNQFEKDN